MQARGYISSQRVRGQRVPQHIQNLVVRKFCEDMGFNYVLSRAEYSFGDNYSQLWAAMNENIPVIVAYSMYQMPKSREERRKVLETSLEKHIEIYFAVEMEILDRNTFKKVDEVLMIIDAIDPTITREYASDMCRLLGIE